MKKLGKVAAALMVLFGCALLTTTLHAQSSFVYTNNDAFGGPNSVSAFSIGSNGALTPVAGSPFPTGGSGFNTSAGGESTATSRIAVTAIPGNFLYASNDVSNSISAFSIDTTTGALTPIPGSPFAAGAVNNFGISLAVTPDGRFLYAGNQGSNTSSISAFSIASNGALTPLPGSPFPAGFPTNMKVTPDGKFLAVAEGVMGMLSIGSNGALTPVLGSPFSVSGIAQGLDVNCASNLLFAPTGIASQGGVNVLNTTSDGVLTPISGSPFTFNGSVSLDDALSPDDQHLFVANLFSDAQTFLHGTITALTVTPGGSLMEVNGSPFATSSGFLLPITMATNQAGTLLYVATSNQAPGSGSFVAAFNIASNGVLSPVLGSPFATGVSGVSFTLPSVAVFPPKSCSRAPTITSISPTGAIAGGAGFTLIVNGTNFVSGSTVSFNGNARTTTFVSATQVTAVILASDIATAGTFNVTVTNPGGITSNAASFTVVTPQDATQAITNSVNVLLSQGVINGGQDNSLAVQLQHAISMINAGKNAGAIGNLDSFISEVNDLLSSGVLSPSQAASLISAAESVIAAI